MLDGPGRGLLEPGKLLERGDAALQVALLSLRDDGANDLFRLA